MRRLSITASVVLTITLSLVISNCRRSSGEVDCDAVVQELRQGTAADKVAADMKTTTSEVYRCLRQANKAEIEKQTRERAAAAGAASPEASPSASAP